MGFIITTTFTAIGAVIGAFIGRQFISRNSIRGQKARRGLNDRRK